MAPAHCAVIKLNHVKYGLRTPSMNKNAPTYNLLVLYVVLIDFFICISSIICYLYSKIICGNRSCNISVECYFFANVEQRNDRFLVCWPTPLKSYSLKGHP